MESRISPAIGNSCLILGSSYTTARAAGLPVSIMYCFMFSVDVMHVTASTAKVSLYLPYALMPSSMPPNGGLLSCAGLTLGYRAQARSDGMFLGMTPFLASPTSARQMYPQLTMKPPRVPFSRNLACSSMSVDRVGLAAG